MIAEQAELNLRLRARRTVTQDAAEELYQLLRGRGWVTAAEIERLRPEWARPDHRFVRLLASAAQGRVLSFPGSPGYRLTAELTAEEIDQLDHAGNARISQGRDLMRSGIRLRRIAALRRAEITLTTARHED